MRNSSFLISHFICPFQAYVPKRNSLLRADFNFVVRGCECKAALKFVRQKTVTQKVAAIRVRRTTARIVPRTKISIHQLLLLAVPGRQFRQRI